jgi:glycosyltransferase involved in cell wall biosynthesis
VAFLGQVEAAEALRAVESARAVVLASTWYEGFPRTVVEAYSMGVPMIASRIGSLTELVEDGVTGLQADPGSPESLAVALKRVAESDELSLQLGAGARRAYEQRYSPSITTDRLIEIYRCVVERRSLPADPTGTTADSSVV